MSIDSQCERIAILYSKIETKREELNSLKHMKGGSLSLSKSRSQHRIPIPTQVGEIIVLIVQASIADELAGLEEQVSNMLAIHSLTP